MLSGKLQIVIFLFTFIKFFICEDFEACEKSNFSESSFVDGRFCEKHEFPWLAVAYGNGEVLCNGVLLTLSIVVFSGRCKFDLLGINYQIAVGITNLSDVNEEGRKLRDGISTVTDEDKLLVIHHLVREFVFTDFFSPICLLKDEELTDDEDSYLIGFSSHNGFEDTPRILRVKTHPGNLSDTEVLSNPDKSLICENGCGLVSLKNGTFYLRGIMSIINGQLISRKINYSNKMDIKFANVLYLNYSTPASTLYQPIIDHYCLYADQCINAGEDMLSPSKCFRLTFRRDGDLGIVPSQKPNIMIWNTRTRFKKGVKACMLRNGNFVMFDKNNGTVWSSNSQDGNAGKIVRTCIHDDGQLLISADEKLIFVSQVTFKCE